MNLKTKIRNIKETLSGGDPVYAKLPFATKAENKVHIKAIKYLIRDGMLLAFRNKELYGKENSQHSFSVVYSLLDR